MKMFISCKSNYLQRNGTKSEIVNLLKWPVNTMSLLYFVGCNYRLDFTILIGCRSTLYLIDLIDLTEPKTNENVENPCKRTFNEMGDNLNLESRFLTNEHFFD